jgi:hypothetical protein
MAGAISQGEVEGWLHSMTMGPLPQEVVRRVLGDHERVQAERAELRAALERLGPAWAELRSALNELNRVLGDR